MPDGPDLDASELFSLTADLGNVPSNIGPKLRSAIGRTSQLTMESWREKASGSETLPHLPRSITYEIKTFQAFGVSVLESEIGPELGGQGSLGHFSEYGSPTSAPRGYGQAALQENEEDFVRGVSQAAEDAIREQTIRGGFR